MNKELTPLDALKCIKAGYIDEERNIIIIVKTAFDNSCATIEKALKDYEEYKAQDIKVCGGSLLTCKSDFETLWKEHKALEIIKNCLIGEYELIDNAPLDKVFNSPYRFRVWADYMHCNEWIVSKEEYNLLKEVLL